MQIFFLICIPSRLMKNRKIFSLAFPYTNDIQTIYKRYRNDIGTIQERYRNDTGRAKESRRAGAAEYVTNNYRRINN